MGNSMKTGPGVPDWAAARASLKVGTISLTVLTEAQNLHSGLKRDIWSMSCSAPLPWTTKHRWQEMLGARCKLLWCTQQLDSPAGGCRQLHPRATAEILPSVRSSQRSLCWWVPGLPSLLPRPQCLVKTQYGSLGKKGGMEGCQNLQYTISYS